MPVQRGDVPPVPKWHEYPGLDIEQKLNKYALDLSVYLENHLGAHTTEIRQIETVQVTLEYLANLTATGILYIDSEGGITESASDFSYNSTAKDLTVDSLVLGGGSITDTSGAISFGNENLSTTGSFGAGAITGTSFVIGANTLDTTEWAYLDGQNQAVKTTSDVTFSTVSCGSINNVGISGPSATSILFAPSDGLSSSELQYNSTAPVGWSLTNPVISGKTLSVTASCVLDQDLQQSASPTFAGLTTGGAVRAPNGAVGTPSFTFTDDITMGMWRDAGGPSLKFSAGSVAALILDENADAHFAADVIADNLIISNNGYIGSASDTDAIQIETDGDVVLTQDLAVAGEVNVGRTGTAGTILAAGNTDAAGEHSGLVEVHTDSTHFVPDALKSAINIECHTDVNNLTPQFRFGGGVWHRTKDEVLTTASKSLYGLYGSMISQYDVTGNYNLILYGLAYTAANNGDLSSDFILGTPLTLYGLYLQSYLGYQGYTIEDKSYVNNYGGYLKAIIDGTYTSTQDSNNYGLYIETQDSLAAAATNGSINNYSLYLKTTAVTNLNGGVSYAIYSESNVPSYFTGEINTGEHYEVDGTQVVGNRVIDARCDDAIDSGDATTDGVIDSLRDAMIAHGLIAAA